MKWTLGAIAGVVAWEIAKPLFFKGLRWYWRLEAKRGWDSA